MLGSLKETASNMLNQGIEFLHNFIIFFLFCCNLKTKIGHSQLFTWDGHYLLWNWNMYTWRLIIDYVEELEDDILSCGLPIYALWLRLEKLRQRVHWYPVSDADCDDPQRVVLPTDVTDFVRPITSSTLTLRLVVITMFLLKVPLIPLRDTVFRSLSLHTITWHMDSSEVLLSLFCSLGITQG